MSWQPIETAPKDESWILLYDPMTSCLIYTGYWDKCFRPTWNEETDDLGYIGEWTNLHVESFGHEEIQKLNPTHWMPLPNPPEL